MPWPDRAKEESLKGSVKFFTMSHLAVQDISKKFVNKKMPVLRPGYQVRVHQKIKEGEKERIQVFEGLVVSMNSGHGSSKTFTVRKVVQGIAVEKVFPVYSPLIAKIEVKKTFGVRRAKLNYLRKPKGVSKRLSAKLGLIDKDELLKKKKGLHEEDELEVAQDTEAEVTAEAEAGDAPAEEAPKAEEKATAPKEEEAQAESVKEDEPKKAPAEAEKAKEEAAEKEGEKPAGKEPSAKEEKKEE